MAAVARTLMAKEAEALEAYDSEAIVDGAAAERRAALLREAVGEAVG